MLKKMYPIEEAPFLREVVDVISNMYRLGWDERNGGNLSYRLDPELTSQYLDLTAVKRRIDIGFDASALRGELFLVTGTGKYFKNVAACPAQNLGIFRVAENGSEIELLWGYEDGGKPTSELPTHLLNHAERMKIDPEQRVVLHCHPGNTLAMTFVHDLDERSFTRTLWRMITECMVVFPEGVGVIPWMVCGTLDIGRATAAKIQDVRVVIWAAHGIFGVGSSIDEAFGLVETVEKAAEVYMKIGDRPIKQSLTDAELAELAKAFGLTPRPGYLEL